MQSLVFNLHISQRAHRISVVHQQADYRMWSLGAEQIRGEEKESNDRDPFTHHMQKQKRVPSDDCHSSSRDFSRRQRRDGVASNLLGDIALLRE